LPTSCWAARTCLPAGSPGGHPWLFFILFPRVTPQGRRQNFSFSLPVNVTARAGTGPETVARACPRRIGKQTSERLPSPGPRVGHQIPRNPLVPRVGTRASVARRAVFLSTRKFGKFPSTSVPPSFVRGRGRSKAAPEKIPAPLIPRRSERRWGSKLPACRCAAVQASPRTLPGRRVQAWLFLSSIALVKPKEPGHALSTFLTPVYSPATLSTSKGSR